MATATTAFAVGDVLKTEPQPGFWGCAVVLTATNGTSEFHPRFHVAITPIVYRRPYAPSEIDMSGLSVLSFSRTVRMAPNDYVPRAEQLCIGIYTAKRRGDLAVIGTVNPLLVYPTPLTLEVGDGTNGAFPLCGPLKKTIGSEAVVAWRRVHDAFALAEESDQARRRFEALEQERLSNQRDRRRTRRSDA